MYATPLPAAPASAAAAALAAAPRMSISLAEGAAGRAAEVGPGSRLRYTVTVDNEGGRAVTGLRLEQSLPDGTAGVAADHGGRPGGARVTWRVDLPAHRGLRLRSSAVLTRAAAGQRRLASTVCAYTERTDAPVVCGSVMNPLAATDATRAGLLGEGGGTDWTLGATGAAALLAAGTVLTLRRRRAPRTR